MSSHDPGDDPFVRKNLRFNFVACSIDAIGWPLGIAFFSPATILPLFLRHLGAGDIAIGALAAVFNLLVFIPGLFVVRYLRHLPRARGYLLWVALVERFALLPLFFLTPLWGLTHPKWLIVALFACIIGHGLAMGLNQPAYWVVVGKSIPPRWRGRLFGFAGGIAGLLGIGTEWLLRHVVLSGPRDGFPNGFANGFLIGFLILTASVLPLGIVREPVARPEDADEDAVPPTLNLSVLRALWRTDHPFRRFLRSQIVFVLLGMVAPFFVVYAKESLGASGPTIAGYTAATIFASAFGSLVWGALADRFGNRPILLAGAGFALAALAFALFSGSPVWFYGVFIATSLGNAGIGLAGNNIVMEYAGKPHAIPLYTAFYNLMTSLPRAIAPLLGGLIARQFGYTWLFAFAAVLGVSALLLTLRVPSPGEPRVA